MEQWIARSAPDLLHAATRHATRGLRPRIAAIDAGVDAGPAGCGYQVLAVARIECNRLGQIIARATVRLLPAFAAVAADQQSIFGGRPQRSAVDRIHRQFVEVTGAADRKFQLAPVVAGIRALEYGGEHPACRVQGARAPGIDQQGFQAGLAESDAGLPPGLAAVGRAREIERIATPTGVDDFRIARINRHDIGILVGYAKVAPGLAAIIRAIVQVGGGQENRSWLRGRKRHRVAHRSQQPAGIRTGKHFPGHP